ncbi:YitT family protein [Clostridium swellfunianum]|uniref:YitT family protein n=1 Tax=Clostridium swellfunianum TaxID=1367462 RepID=UPI00202E2BA7|nr:YitT family protein [Clostridium swellfunianum]MCM0646985.1 YitT family protein [Clostridium swellfunianum]
MKDLIKEYSLILLGSVILSIAIAAFLLPSQIGSGGVTGIAMVINNIFGIKVGLLTIILNIPLFIFGYKLIGRKFAVRSGFVVVLSSLLIDYFNSIFHFKPIDDILLSSIFCGVLFGVSVYLIFMSYASTGGLDILAKIINSKFKNLQLSNILLVQDFIVYSLIAYVFGPRSVMYALIASFIRTKTIDAIQEGIASSRQCIIICQNSTEMISVINTQLVRGVTVLDAVGGYSNDKKKLIYVVIQRTQLNALRAIVKEIEPNAFVAVSPVNDILGNYRQLLTMQ